MIPAQVLGPVILAGKAVLAAPVAALEGAVEETLFVRGLDVPLQVGFAAVGLGALRASGRVQTRRVVAVAGAVCGGGSKRGGGE